MVREGGLLLLKRVQSVSQVRKLSHSFSLALGENDEGTIRQVRIEFRELTKREIW